MKKDTTYGPPKEMFSHARKKRRRRTKDGDEGDSDQDFQLDEHDDGGDMAQLRKYEVNKMKYYYGIITCNKSKTANRIYEEYQGFEFELTNLRLSLSLVPDEMLFEQKARDECEEIPPNYTFHDSKISRALNHSTIKLTWDAADPRRQARMQANASANKKKKKGKK